MSNMSVSAKSATPFEKLASSTPAKFAKDNAVLAGSIAVVGLTGVAYVAYSHDKAGEAKK